MKLVRPEPENISSGDKVRIAIQLMNRGQLAQCIEHCDRHLANCTNALAAGDLLSIKALALAHMGEMEAGQSLIDQLVSHAPKLRISWLRRQSIILALCGQFDYALGVVDRILEAVPGYPVALLNRASFLVQLGDYADALTLLESLPASFRNEFEYANAYAIASRKLGNAEAALTAIDRVALQQLSWRNQRTLLSERSFALDARGRFDEAFASAREANGLWLQNSGLSADISLHRDATDRLIRSWEKRSNPPRDRFNSSSPSHVFIVGMPRSGSTLLEQMLDAHPEFQGLGEVDWFQRCADPLDTYNLRKLSMLLKLENLADESLDKIGQCYAARVAAAIDSERGTPVDKRLNNYKLLGVIGEAIPGAKFIWIRRHPLDSILSCYLQNFRHNSEFARLDFTCSYYWDVHRTMTFWLERFPDRVSTCDYESLVVAPRDTLEPLLSRLGSIWSDRCSDFHQSSRVANSASRHQVNVPLYNSSRQRWKNYQQHLQAPLEFLQSKGVLDSEGRPTYWNA